jgi:hypothetical protein
MRSAACDIVKDGTTCAAQSSGRVVEAPLAGLRNLRDMSASSWLYGPGEELKEGALGVEYTFPRCRKCGAGDLVPLSDFGSQGASIQFKAWVCTNPNCLYNVKIRNGDIIINEPVSDGSMHSYRGAR